MFHFNYLGSIQINNNNIQIEIDTKLKKDYSHYYGLPKLLNSKAISKNLKV